MRLHHDGRKLSSCCVHERSAGPWPDHPGCCSPGRRECRHRLARAQRQSARRRAHARAGKGRGQRAGLPDERHGAHAVARPVHRGGCRGAVLHDPFGDRATARCGRAARPARSAGLRPAAVRRGGARAAGGRDARPRRPQPRRRPARGLAADLRPRDRCVAARRPARRPARRHSPEAPARRRGQRPRRRAGRGASARKGAQPHGFPRRSSHQRVRIHVLGGPEARFRGCAPARRNPARARAGAIRAPGP